MNTKVFVTGLGAISAIGNDVKEVYSSLIRSNFGIADIEYLDTIHKGKIVVGEVKCSNNELFKILNLPPDITVSRTSLLGMIAAREAVNHAKIDNLTNIRTGFISGTSVGGMDKFELYFPNLIGSDKKAKIAEVISHDCGNGSQQIADYLGLRGYMTTISTACSSSANSIMLGTRLIKSGILDRVIVGGTDALTKFTINGFNTLMILDKEHCKPFDNNRKGLNLGEAAAYLVIESEQSAKGKKLLAEVSGYANANDAYHQTASSPDGIGNYNAMTKAIKIAGVEVADISYINVHGTGTENNDIAEGTAIKKIFGNSIPKFSSTKAFTGHTLGAAGALEAVISVLSITQKVIFPNLNFSQPINTLDLIPVTSLVENVELNHVMSNSFGFGGNCSSLIFSKVK